MRLVSKRVFEVDDPILMVTRRCRDTLFQTDSGEFLLHLFAEDQGEKLIRLNVIAASAWLNASPDEFGIEWGGDLD